VAILSAIAEAIPFASYLPVDIASNQAKLAILSDDMGSQHGCREDQRTTAAVANKRNIRGTLKRVPATEQS